MKMYYITTLEKWASHVAHFRESHYIPLDGDNILIAAKFVDEGSELHWSSHPEVHSLPHPLSSAKISQKHHNLLKNKLATDGTETTFDVSEKAKAISPSFALTVF